MSSEADIFEDFESYKQKYKIFILYMLMLPYQGESYALTLTKLLLHFHPHFIVLVSISHDIAVIGLIKLYNKNPHYSE